MNDSPLLADLAMNVAEIEFRLKELAERPYDPATFIFDLIEAYSAAKPIPRSTLAKLRQGSLNKATLQGDVLWAKKVHFRPASPMSAGVTVEALGEAATTSKHAPRFLISSDGDEIVALDLKLDEILSIPFALLNERFDFFLPLVGVERFQGVADSPADIRAAGRLAQFYDAILAANPAWTNHQKVHELNLFLTRVLFSMFAQSTGIIEQDLFSRTLIEFTSIDGSDVQGVLTSTFLAMSSEGADRKGLPVFAARFPYVNGGLFKDASPVPNFDRLSRRILIDAAKLNWAEINPDIFGSMIQAVVKPELRGDLGLHYTSVPNIMKALRPLFLDELEEQYHQAEGNIKKLDALLARIRSIRVFDPACGSGNFLIIAYKELCRLERRVFEALKRQDRQLKLPLSEIRLDQFVGIEIEDFAAQTAKLSMYVAQHQMNVEFKSVFGYAPPALPLKDAGQIQCGNATRLDWTDVCPPNPKCETFIVGNPPYLGGKKLTPSQSNDMEFSGLKQLKQLDYVACWFLKAASYSQKFPCCFSFVATSSICQGEQVHLLWPKIISLGLEITFIYLPFSWKNSAKLNAAVACTVVGISPRAFVRKKTIFGEEFQKSASNISPYMIDFDDVYVLPERAPLSSLPEMTMGSNAVDGKNLIVDASEFSALRASNDIGLKFIKKYLGGDEYLYDIDRYCIWIEDDEVATALRSEFIANRIAACEDYRAGAGRDARRAARTPYKFCYSTYEPKDFILVPNTSAATRPYLPIGLLDGGVVVNHNAFVIYEQNLTVLGLLSSTLHRVWLAAVGGRLDMRYRYSVKLVYNTFPLPELSADQASGIEEAAWSILEARAKHPEKTVAELYDSDMPNELLEAHRSLDEVVEHIYLGRPFLNDTERLEHLFRRYKLMTEKRHLPLLSRRRPIKRASTK